MQFLWFMVQALMVLAMVLTMVRLLLGPTMANRVVALDLFAVLAAGLTAVQAVRTHDYALIDVAVVVGIVGFIGTTAFALLIDRDPGAADVE